MKLLLDSFWRAAAYLMRPRVLALTLLPLLIAGGLFLVLGYFFWEPAVAAVRASWRLVADRGRAALAGHLHGGQFPGRDGADDHRGAGRAGGGGDVPAAGGAADDAGPGQPGGRAPLSGAGAQAGALWESAWRSGLFTLVAMVALILTVPLWLVPPLALVIPPVIWGWLTAQVMTYDALAEHASLEERLTCSGSTAGPCC
jgi:hypothetical protein